MKTKVLVAVWCFILIFNLSPLLHAEVGTLGQGESTSAGEPGSYPVYQASSSDVVERAKVMLARVLNGTSSRALVDYLAFSVTAMGGHNPGQYSDPAEYTNMLKQYIFDHPDVQKALLEQPIEGVTDEELQQLVGTLAAEGTDVSLSELKEIVQKIRDEGRDITLDDLRKTITELKKENKDLSTENILDRLVEEDKRARETLDSLYARLDRLTPEEKNDFLDRINNAKALNNTAASNLGKTYVIPINMAGGDSKEPKGADQMMMMLLQMLMKMMGGGGGGGGCPGGQC